jgi:hypothetical protein
MAIYDSATKSYRKTMRYHAIAFFGIVALATLFLPIQNWISLGRYQHYGIVIFIFGLGYVVQIAYAWTLLSKWTKISYLATGLFFTSVGLVFYANPWLDYKVAVQTEEKDRFRGFLVCFYVTFSLAIVGIWVKWLHEQSYYKNGKNNFS